MDRENQTLEEVSQSSVRKSDRILLIAFLAFIVLLAVAIIIVIIDTRGLWISPPGGIHPGFLWKALRISF